MHQCRHSLQLSNFNPRSHERSDTSSVVAKQCDRVFQSTLPREERHRYNLKCLMFEDYFNPRSHERSDCCHLITAQLFIISIHAPTRGATSAKFPVNVYVEVISIHAPTRGATATHWQPRGNHHQFQSTLPREERQLFVAVKVWYPIFQSTLPREERLLVRSGFRLSWYFNPRSHERSDGFGCRIGCDYCYFNPRSHERSDICSFARTFQCSHISIHAPTRGATINF